MTPTFQGEVQFRRYSDTSSQGQQIVCAVADREALESFIGKEGKRFMAVFVEIGDDELPVEPVKPAVKVGPLCREAVDLCKMPAFQAWLQEVDDVGAKLRILGVCNIYSRKDLDSNADAAKVFINYFRLPFIKYMNTLAHAK